MLIYHPAFDVYHCAFRIIAVTNIHRVLDFPKFRILDYYLCFPAEVAAIQLPQEHSEIRKAARAAKNPYRGPVGGERTFRELEPIQSAAARLLALTGTLSPTELESGRIVRTGSPLPDVLAKSVKQSSGNFDEIQSYVLSRLAEFPLQGVGGLKQRTGLMEYRYDTTETHSDR